MLHELVPAARDNGGYLLTRHLLGMGLSERAIARERLAENLFRVRHGTYVPMPLWREADATERHVIVVRSVIERMGCDVVASHASAAALHGLDLYGIDLDVVHLTRLDGVGGRREAGVVVHENAVAPDELVELSGGVFATNPVRATVETCGITSVESGMVTASSLLRTVGTRPEDLERMAAEAARWPGARRAKLAIRLSDGLLQSAGEARSLYMMWRHGVPRPELQHRVSLGDGRSAFLDFWWPDHRHAGEFDGLHKYGRLNPYADDPARALVEEKIREDAVRALGIGVSRWIWRDLAPGVSARTAVALLAAMEVSARLYGRRSTVIDLG